MQFEGEGPVRAAVSGDRRAFGKLTEPHRRELQVHCYRMLGSIADAEDLVQETFLRAWRSRRTYAGRAPFRAWLYGIATNACLDELAARPRRGLPMSQFSPADPDQPPGPPILDPIWVEPYPDSLLPPVPADPASRYDQRESIRLAFVVALQELTPLQRAVLLLREVLGWKAAEVAVVLDRTVSSITSALYRARVALGERQRKDGRWPSTEDVKGAAERQLLERYLLAWETADIEGLVSLLREDATFPMPPLPGWYRGRAAIRKFLSGTVLRGAAGGRWRLVSTRANGAPAFGLYRKLEGGQLGYEAFAIQVLTLAHGLVADVTTFGFPGLFPAFGLPETMAG